MKKKPQTLEEVYKVCLLKACTRHEIPCKEKHIRRIIDSAHRDASGVHFFVSFDNMIKVKDSIVRFKCLTILHMLFRCASFSKNLERYIPKMLEVNSKMNCDHVIYYQLCQIYSEFFLYKLEFFKKLPFLTHTYQLAEDLKTIPFKSLQGKIGFLKEVSLHFTLHCKPTNEIIKNTQNSGIDPSVLPANQCQLRALIPLLQDLQDIFILLHLIARNISESEDIDSSILVIFQESFTPRFKLYTKLLERVSYFTYVTEIYTLPKLPETYPFLKESFYQKKISTQTLTPQRSRTPSTASIEEKAPILASTKDSPQASPIASIENIFFESIPVKPPLQEDSLKIKDLEAKLSDYEEILNKNDFYKNKVDDLLYKIEAITRGNEELREKLDSQKLILAETSEYKQKFETMSNLYAELRKRYMQFSQSTSQSETLKSNYIAENQLLREEADKLKNEILNNSDDFKKIKNECDQYKAQIAQLFEEKNKISFKKLLELITDNNLDRYKKHAETYVCWENMSKAHLIKIFQETKDVFRVLFYSTANAPQDFISLVLIQMHLQYSLTTIFSLSQEYLNNCFDQQYENLLTDLIKLYESSMMSFKNGDPFNFDSFLASYDSIIDRIIEIINEKTEIFSRGQQTLKDFDFEKELANVIKIVEEAARQILANVPSEVQNKESHELLIYVNDLFGLIKKLIVSTQKLELEVLDNEGTKICEREKFYQKNSAWATGMVGFAKAISPTVISLIEAIKGFVKGEVFIEELTVSLNNVSTLVTQLLVASRIKAHPSSQNLALLKNTTFEIRAKITEVSSSANKTLTSIDSSNLDISSLTRIKKMSLENEIQIKILSLEKDLENERRKLCQLRSLSYK